MIFLSTNVERLPHAWREAAVPRVKKKRFASCRHIGTAVVVDLRALIKEACFVWC